MSLSQFANSASTASSSHLPRQMCLYPFAAGATVLVLLSVLTMVSSSLAGTPGLLQSPNGLAVDAKGNLLVANYAAGNILVFGPDYKQISNRTITQGISFPISVALDSFGSLWVLNVGTSSVTHYTHGVQDTGDTITNGVSSPHSMTVDGLGDVYVQNGDANITVYAPASASAPASTLAETFVPTNCTECIGTILASAQALYWTKGNGGDEVRVAPTGQGLVTDNFNGSSIGLTFASAMGADGAGSVYVGTIDNSVYLVDPSGKSKLFIANLGFEPFGIAVDSVRKRVYISNQEAGQIVVYSTAGVLLHTIM
jgi:sugar lactone lactonase YvrE